MAFPKPQNSRGRVNRAGEILRAYAQSVEAVSIEEEEEASWAYDVLSNWRACHNYPINTFQATLRGRLKTIDKSAAVAQRLKRFPSIVAKLQRFEGMQLARMQDIGGLRAILGTIKKVRQLEQVYRDRKFQHTLVSSKDYIAEPKGDGYRSIHLIYRYRNSKVPDYDGLLLELQLRTRLQHAWGTAVETMGTYLGQALKSGQGEDRWRSFFEVAGSAIAHLEDSQPIPGYDALSRMETFKLVAEREAELKVLEKLRGFSVATEKIVTESGQGSFHLVILNSADKSVSIRPYSLNRLEQANADYAVVEKQVQSGEPVEAVLVSAGSVEALKKAYPNYFLDTHEFIRQIETVIDVANNPIRARRRRLVRVRRRRAAIRPA
jgi:putative GTP pyrophosphokinase